MGEIDKTLDHHEYTSTACQHNLHARCRVSCKFCWSKCECSCHEKEKENNGNL